MLDNNQGTRMQKELDPKIALLIVVFFSVVLLGWYHVNSKALEVASPGFLKLNPAENIVINLGSEFYEITAQGQDVVHFSALDYGLAEIHGDFDFFSNGDILLYSSSYQPTLRERLDTFAREAGPDQAEQEGEGFFRCPFDGSPCLSFGQDLPAFPRTFRLAIDTEDNVYIADTSRHRLFKLDSQGRLLATLDKGLEFPNGLLSLDDSLWQVNTNHHQLVELAAGKLDFGSRRGGFVPEMPGRDFPSGVARLGEYWFVLSMDTAMANGRIGQYSLQGELLNIVELERGADPIGLLAVDDFLLIPDLRNMHYWRVELADLSKVGVFSSEHLTSRLAAAKQEQNQYRRLAWVIVALALLIFAALVYWGLRQEVDSIDCEIEALDRGIAQSSELPGGKHEYWLSNSLEFSQFKRLIPWFIPLLFFASSVAFVMLLFANIPSALLPLLMIVMCYFLRRLTTQMLEVGVGVAGPLVLLKGSAGRVAIGKHQQVYSSNSVLCIDDVMVPIKLFDAVEFERWVKPRLQHANKLSELQMIAKQWELRYPGLLIPLQLFGVMLLMLVLPELLD